MTTEVAILNKNAVALAADSAMTTAAGKIYPTNKLFALSHHWPTGIMVYNNSEFMGLPWETVVKSYRDDRGGKRFDTLASVFADFCDFLSSVPLEEGAQEENLERIVRDSLERVRNAILEELVEKLEDGEEADLPAVAEVALERLEGTFRRMDELSDSHIHEVLDAEEVSQSIERMVEPFVEELPFFNNAGRRLIDFVGMVMRKSLSRSFAGIVVAGYGRQDMFPSIIALETDGVIRDRLICGNRVESAVSRDQPACIAPFAQDDMVKVFMQGIDGELLSYLNVLFTQAVHQFAAGVLSNLGMDRDELGEEVARAVNAARQEFLPKVREFIDEEYVEPTMHAVADLPKEELASMAEALVSLTSLKRRISQDDETVGGPVDVALISKGDGFVWINRKHYFSGELNQDFVARRLVKVLQERE